MAQKIIGRKQESKELSSYYVHDNRFLIHNY